MTEKLLQKVEDKVLLLLTELEHLRKEVQHLKVENLHLKAAQDSDFTKLKSLLGLFDSLEGLESHTNPQFDAV